MSDYELGGAPTEDLDKRSEPRRDGPMDESELQSAVGAVLTDCVEYVDNELSPQRALVTKYYQGQELGNEEEGRSRVVTTDVRDGICAVLPYILDVFFGSERCVEYVPTGPLTTAQARQATDYAQYVFSELNAGFLEAHSVLKDGLMKKLGAFKVLWDDSDEKKAFKFENVTSAQLEVLEEDENVTIRRITETGRVPIGTAGPALRGIPGPATDSEPAEDATPAPQGGPAAPGGASGAPQPIGTLGLTPGAQSAATEPVHTVELTLNRSLERLRVFAVPPEELVFSREARSKDDAVCMAHRTHKTRGELRAMGVKEADLDAHGGDDISLRHNVEEIERREVGGEANTQDAESGEFNDRVLYCEAYIHVDYDGDGIAELRKICTLGPTYWVISNEPANRRPFAVYTPDPEPHTLVGSSWADRLMDIQKWRSSIVRGINDSLSLSMFPRTVVQEGLVNMQDVFNTEIGATIRARGPNAVMPLTVPFVGKEAMVVLEYIDQIVERRTGQSDGANGLDADALQSTGKEAVQAVLTASQSQIELLCRIFAEQCMKPLFKLILQELVERQPRKQMVRLRGEWVEVDPRSWDVDMDVTVHVGLGKSYPAKKIQTLLQVAAEQKDILSTYGPVNPMVRVAQYRETLAELLALNGYPDASPYFDKVPDNWQPPAPAAPPPTPEMIQAQAQIQIEQMKTQRELAIKESELQLKRQAQAHDQMIAEKKIAMDFTLRRYQIDAQFKAAYTSQQADADATDTQQWMDAQDQVHTQALARSSEAHKQALAAQAQQHAQGLAEDQQAHDQAISQQTVDQQAAQPDEGSA